MLVFGVSAQREFFKKQSQTLINFNHSYCVTINLWSYFMQTAHVKKKQQKRRTTLCLCLWSAEIEMKICSKQNWTIRLASTLDLKSSWKLKKPFKTSSPRNLQPLMFQWMNPPSPYGHLGLFCSSIHSKPYVKRAKVWMCRRNPGPFETIGSVDEKKQPSIWPREVINLTSTWCPPLWVYVATKKYNDVSCLHHKAINFEELY